MNMVRPQRIGHVAITVSDLERSTAFYRDALGLEEKGGLPGYLVSLCSNDDHHDIALMAARSSAHEKGTIGLHHFAYRMASYDDLRTIYAHFKASGVPVVEGKNHGPMHSLYVQDPDGNRIELYADVPFQMPKNPAGDLLDWVEPDVPAAVN
jgi:catechol-2,3-dioxygenase